MLRQACAHPSGGRQERRSAVLPMSALPPKADKQQTSRYVRFVELADAAIGAAAQHDPRRRAGVDRILDDDSAVDDDSCARAAWVAMRVGVSRLVAKIVRIKDCDVGSVALLQ